MFNILVKLTDDANIDKEGPECTDYCAHISAGGGGYKKLRNMGRMTMQTVAGKQAG